MKKIDLKKEDPIYYKAKQEAELCEFKACHYISIEGVGSPESTTFQESIPAIHAAAYAIKKQSQTKEKDFVISKMEGLWWVKDDLSFDDVSKDEWHWKILIRQPDFINEAFAKHAFDYVCETKDLSQSTALKYEVINEGTCIQILHLGSYDEEKESIDKIIALMEKKQMRMNGHHHEIYLSDPRNTPVEKLKTILRYPVRQT